MHIMVLCHHYRPEVGAPQRRWDKFVEVWRSLGHDVTVVTSLPHYPTGRLLPDHRVADFIGSRLGEHGETVIRVPFLPVGRRGGAAKLGDQAFVAVLSALAGIAVSPPDVVVSSVPGPATIATGDAVAAWHRVPHVIELRDAWPDLLYQGSPDSVRVPASFGRWMTRRQRHADAIVSVTRGFADELARRGVHRSRLHHIPNGIDLEDVPALAPPSNHDGPLRVLYLGTHGVSQRLDLAVEALAGLGGSIEARFIGDGTDKASLRQLAETRQSPIWFGDSVSGNDLWDAYAWADTCLVHLAPLPAFKHTVPSKLYELMALGRHVTGVVEGEAASIIREAEAGAVVQPGNPAALRTSLLDLSTRARPAAQTGRQWVAGNADLRVLGARYITLLEEVAS